MSAVKSPTLRLKAVAAFLVLGGAWSLVKIARASSTVQVGDGVRVALRLPILLAITFALASLAGVLLWRCHRLGARAAVLALAAQLVSFHIADGFEFRFTSGACVLVGVIGSDLGFSAFEGAGLIASSSPGDGSFMVNVVAGAALILLMLSRRDQAPEIPRTG
jgi:hypothetical protein